MNWQCVELLSLVSLLTPLSVQTHFVIQLMLFSFFFFFKTCEFFLLCRLSYTATCTDLLLIKAVKFRCDHEHLITYKYLPKNKEALVIERILQALKFLRMSCYEVV